MSEASYSREASDIRLTVVEAVALFEVYQLPDGSAGYQNAGSAATAGQPNVSFRTTGQVTLPKTANIKLLDGGRAYWDHSANLVHFKRVNDRDFYLGRVVGDAEADAQTCAVNLNVDPPYDIDLARDPFNSVLVGTAAAGGFGYPVQLGGGFVLEISATNEAQKVDLLAVDGFAINANAIIEFAFRILNDGAAGTQDLSVGFASGTHASDFEAVAEFVAIHLDGNDTKIYIESDDGVTDIPPTDSTTVYSEGSAVANRKELWLDLRNPSDVQCYVDGVLVLPATIFTLAAAAGPLFPICHLEKQAGTDIYRISVDFMRARLSQQ